MINTQTQGGKMKGKFLRDIWDDIRQGRNLEVYLTVLICVVVLVLDLFDIADLKIVTSAILAVLSLEAFSLLANRRNELELQRALAETTRQLARPRLAEVIVPYTERMKELTDHLLQADEVWILSRTCRRMWGDYEDELRTIAARHGLRLLVVDPSNGALDMITRSAVWQQPDDSARLKSNVEQFITLLGQVRGTLRLEKFELRLLDYLPAWTLVVINPHKDTGVIYVELATYRSHPRKRPSLKVECGTDYELFSQLLYEFEEMWRSARSAWQNAAVDTKA
jgi:hypothetical protein